MTITDDLLRNNEQYAAQFTGPLPLPPPASTSPCWPAWMPGSTSTEPSG